MPRIRIERVARAEPDNNQPSAAAGLPPDGRQSRESLAIRRGVCRRLRDEGFSVLAELVLATGRRADIAALSGSGEIVIVEVKSSVADFRSDAKWPQYLAFADRFYFATARTVPHEIFPGEVGLIVADAYGAEFLRPAPLAKMSAATRKAMLIRMARSGMTRLHDLEDPGAA